MSTGTANASAMDVHDAAVASSRSDDTLVIVSSVLSEFHDHNSPTTIATSSKILLKLLHNAIQETDDPAKRELFRRVRLGNPKIQQHIVKVEGALDVLGLAGFVEKLIDNDWFLVYEPKQGGTTNALELYLVDDPHHEKPTHALVHAICRGLETKMSELDPWIQKQKQQVKPASSSSNANASGPFLTEEERVARAVRIKAMKQAREAERAAAKERFFEDMQERKEAERRREALLHAKAREEAKKGLAVGITIRAAAASTPTILPKPFEVPDTDNQKEQLAAAARARQLRSQASSTPKVSEVDVDTMDVEPPESASSVISSGTQAETGESWNDKKPAAKGETVMVESATTVFPVSPEWKAFTERVPRCAGAEGIRESSYYAKAGATDDGMSVPMCLKRLFKELDGLKEMLPSDPNCSIWLRFDEETPQYIRALITAPLPGPTPYSGGLFLFDIFIPGNYPQESPKVQLLTTGQGTVRFGPNLYADGKVCLSLLGTWNGPKWNPRHSSLYQVLISIQGLLLGVEHPYYLEPGHGGWEGHVKEGAFQKQAQTLNGTAVREEVGVPINVVLYEDQLRVGTAKFAMIHPLRAASRSDQEAGSNNKKDDMYDAFYDIIHATFGHNREAILMEVRAWMSDHTFGRNRSAANTESLTIDQLKSLVPVLEKLLSEVPALATIGSTQKANDQSAMDVEDDKKMPPRPSFAKPPPIDEVEDMPKSSSKVDTTAGGANLGSDDWLEEKRQKMQAAASQGDYVLAGQLQEEIRRLDELSRSIQEAAQQNDFIRAGRLQAQFKALTEAYTSSAAPKKSSAASMWNDDDDSDDGDEDGDDWMEEGGPPINMGNGGPHPVVAALPVATHPQPPVGLGKNVFAPPSYMNKFASANHPWGTGLALKEASAPSPTEQKVDAVAAAAGTKKRIPPEQLCRLRIRLPNNKSVVEDFDKNDQLSAVYRRLSPLVPEEKRMNKPVAIAPASTGNSGAFSKPLSSVGFTLLLTRPKREFSLEMHGTKSLTELNLAPSATLTVMKCSDRGIMYRGELESRLQQAQGMAMDVDGLTYESLVELTERVGAAAPNEGEAFVSISAEELEQYSKTFSPSSYLEELDASMEEVDKTERKCPICLGTYDPTDTTDSLRQLTNCGHHFHTACVETWLGTKSSCPLCKTSVKPENA